MTILPRAEHDLDTGHRPGGERVSASACARSIPEDPAPANDGDPELARDPADDGDPELAREVSDVVRMIDFVASGATRWVMLAGLRRAPEVFALGVEPGAGVSLRLDSPTSILVVRDGD